MGATISSGFGGTAGTTGGAYGISGANQEKNVHYRDVALIRERIMDSEVDYFDGHKENLLRIVNDHGFMNIFLKRAAHEYWHSVLYIQTNVKSKIGCGTPIVIKYYAPLNMENIDSEINYDFKSYGSDSDLVKSGDDQAYCTKQVLKMCYYI